MKVKILFASQSDLPDILNLVTELAIFEKEPNAVTATIEDYIKAFETELISAFVAKVDNQTVGMALFYDTFSTWKGKMLYLEDFYVQPHFRNLKIGSMLFDKVIQEAKDRGCKLIKWQVLDWNEKAISFYKKKNAIIEDEWYNGKIIF